MPPCGFDTSTAQLRINRSPTGLPPPVLVKYVCEIVPGPRGDEVSDEAAVLVQHQVWR